MAKVTPDNVIACPPLITEKVRQFDEHLETYTSGDYSEAQLRVDFLNPMIEALGWDVNNRKGYAEAYRDVVYEDAIKVGGTTKAPDYGFYIGGRAAGGGRKFFIEAKKPSVAIRVDPKSAFQLRRYAYSAELPLSILTNFKEFIAYDTRFKPSANDSATAAAVLRIQYTEYAERWHEIASVFSRDAILRGAFDKFAQGKRKKGMEQLGESFLKDIEGWRDLLAREIAASNPDISVDDLNFAVQRTIDRILFLRICEDRGIEPPHNLMQLLNGDRVYDRLGQIFRGADDRYNSGIFHFPAAGKKPDPDRAEPPDELTLDLRIDDKPLKQIISGLYDMPGLFTSYAFAVIPPEILGHVYEQFLGKVIRLTPGHRVKIEEKPEVRKAGGVYYTPVYIVDYIVKNTVGKLLEGKSPKDAEKLRILDPASGSGSFLIGAYQFLLDWHLRWYLDNDPEKHCKGRNPALMRIHSPSLDGEPDAPRTRSNGRYDYRLTTAKRKAILLNCIYGVDIDPQAIEVTKLSLLLKVLEGESQESITAQMKFLHQRALPDLGRNIKCGNSLIGDDFDDSELSDDERKKINRFNWKTGFPQIFKSGGFDAVIGNPPYVYRNATNNVARAYYLSKYKSAEGNFELYKFFLEQGLKLVRRSGRLGMIVSASFLVQPTFTKLRSHLLTNSAFDSLSPLGPKVFDGATVDTAIIVLTPDKNAANNMVRIRAPETPSELPTTTGHDIRQGRFLKNPNTTLDYRLSDAGAKIVTRLFKQFPCVEEHFEFGVGINTGFIKAKLVSKRKTDTRFHRMVPGSGISRYGGVSTEDWIMYDPDFVRKQRDRGRSLPPERFFRSPKILVVRTRNLSLKKRIVATIDNQKFYNLNRLSNIISRGERQLQLLLGILNSRLFDWMFSTRFYDYEIKPVYLRSCPLANGGDDRMVKLVDRMLDLHKKLAAAKSPLDKERIPREIEATDRQIDTLVYDLYGLSEEEIAIVETE